MQHVRKIIIASLFAIILAPAFGSEAKTNGEWTPLFDGNTLDGWEQRGGEAVYTVEDGMIVGTSQPDTPNSFLCTKKRYSDFILELDFKVHPDLNSGIQIRSNSDPDYEDGVVYGYQVEIEPETGETGGIYDEARRGWLDQLKDDPKAQKAAKPGEWNHLRIKAVGDHIQTWVNGVPAADLKDDMTAEGFIGLQVHSVESGEKLPVMWKNIRIKDLSGKSADAGSEAKSAGSESDTEMAPLNIELPKPLFIGTPQNIRSPNLERPTGKARPPFMAPKGAKNVALNADVTASDSFPVIGEVELLTDGDKEGTDGSFVEFGPGVQWVQIDLGDVYEIYAIVMWHYHSQARVYHDVIVQTSTDPDFLTNVKTIYNNDHDNSAGMGIGKDKEYIETSEGRLIDAKGVEARYVKLYSNGNTSNSLNHYIEVEVYGKPVQ